MLSFYYYAVIMLIVTKTLLVQLIDGGDTESEPVNESNSSIFHQ